MEWFMYASFLVALLSILYAFEGIKRTKELEERIEELEKNHKAIPTSIEGNREF